MRPPRLRAARRSADKTQQADDASSDIAWKNVRGTGREQSFPVPRFFHPYAGHLAPGRDCQVRHRGPGQRDARPGGIGDLAGSGRLAVRRGHRRCRLVGLVADPATEKVTSYRPARHVTHSQGDFCIFLAHCPHRLRFCNQILRFGVSHWRCAAFSIIIAQQSVGADLSDDQ